MLAKPLAKVGTVLGINEVAVGGVTAVVVALWMVRKEE